MADPLDLCTRAEVKLSRRETSATFDDLIDALITRASAAITTHTGRQFTQTASSARHFPIGPDGTVILDDLSAAPTAVAVIDASGAVASTLTVATDVILSPRNQPAGWPLTGLTLRYGTAWSATCSPWSPYPAELRVTGTWGWPAIPPDVREAAVSAVIDWLKAAQALTIASPDAFEPGEPPNRGFPRKARDLLRPYRHPGVA